MRGAVLAGMCLVLEAAGLMSSVDRVYGCLGRVVRLFRGGRPGVALGHQLRGLRQPDLHRTARALRGRPMLDLDFLFDEVMPSAGRCPRRGGARPRGPHGRGVRVARGAAGAARLREPGGRPGRRAGELLDPGADGHAADVPRGTDGRRRSAGADPYRTALREGATHVLVLRSRTRASRARRAGSRSDARSRPSGAVPLLRGFSERYNRDAAELERDRPVARSCGRSPSRRAAPGAWLRHRSRAHRRQRPAGRVHDGLCALRRAATRFWQPFPDLLPATAAFAPRLAA